MGSQLFRKKLYTKLYTGRVRGSEVDTKTFGVVGNVFINSYSKENPILEIGQEAFFIFTNIRDYHRPLIGKGKIMFDTFIGGVDKSYYIKLTDILETEEIINKFVVEQMIPLFKPSIIDDKISFKIEKSQHNLSAILDWKQQLLKEEVYLRIDAFFIRNTYEKIFEMRKEYIELVRADVQEQLNDIDLMLGI